jgi:predicted DsbA family dithiol-disulfide isomerase
MRQAQVQRAARAAGVGIAFDRIAVFPNTLAAHRLIAAAQVRHGKQIVPALIAMLFDHYFRRGADIGDAAVLARIASACGVDADAPGAHPDAATDAAPDFAAQSLDVHAVPRLRFNDRVVVDGAQSASALLAAMRRALSSQP